MLKEARVKEPLWKDNDYKAQKKGIRNTVYSVNGDQYTGEWLNNLKDGKCLLCMCVKLNCTVPCQDLQFPVECLRPET